MLHKPQGEGLGTGCFRREAVYDVEVNKSNPFTDDAIAILTFVFFLNFPWRADTFSYR